MSEAAQKRVHTWLLVAVSIGTLMGWVKTSGAQDQIRLEHERRLTMLESKLEQALKEQSAKFEATMREQAIMAGDIRVIRALAEQNENRNP